MPKLNLSTTFNKVKLCSNYALYIPTSYYTNIIVFYPIINQASG